jgi:hypothetical protein
MDEKKHHHCHWWGEGRAADLLARTGHDQKAPLAAFTRDPLVPSVEDPLTATSTAVSLHVHEEHVDYGEGEYETSEHGGDRLLDLYASNQISITQKISMELN